MNEKERETVFYDDLVNGLFEFLKHGNMKHRAWLRKALIAFFRGEPRPPVE